MKSILLKKTSPFILLFLLIFSGALFYSFSNSEKSNKKTEYLSIVVNYALGTQTIHITEGTSNSKKITHPNIEGIFDNKLVFKLFQQYGAEGWKLESHNFGVGTGADDINKYETKISYYLFTK